MQPVSSISRWIHSTPLPQLRQPSTEIQTTQSVEAQWPIGYGVGLRIKRSSVRIRPWPLRWVLGQGSLLPLSQGEAFTLASISYLAILVKYILAKKKKKKKRLFRKVECKLHHFKPQQWDNQRGRGQYLGASVCIQWKGKPRCRRAKRTIKRL